MKSVYYCVSARGLKSRFVENIKLSNIKFYEETSNIDIYKYAINNVQNYIISIDRLDNQSLMFIDENKQKYNIFIDATSDEFYLNHNDALDGVSYLVNSDMKVKNCINVSKFINYNLFNNNEISNNRKNILAVFLNNTTEVPYNLVKQVSKNNLDYRVRFFDNTSISHPCNVGLVSEKDKADILKTYRYFLSLNNNYVYEAYICGIQLIDIKNFKSLSSHPNFDQAVSIQNFIDKYLI